VPAFIYSVTKKIWPVVSSATSRSLCINNGGPYVRLIFTLTSPSPCRKMVPERLTWRRVTLDYVNVSRKWVNPSPFLVRTNRCVIYTQPCNWLPDGLALCAASLTMEDAMMSSNSRDGSPFRTYNDRILSSSRHQRLSTTRWSIPVNLADDLPGWGSCLPVSGL